MNPAALCAECDSLLNDCVSAVKAYNTAVSSLQVAAVTGDQELFAQRQEEAGEIAMEADAAMKTYQKHLRGHKA